MASFPCGVYTGPQVPWRVEALMSAMAQPARRSKPSHAVYISIPTEISDVIGLAA